MQNLIGENYMKKYLKVKLTIFVFFAIALASFGLILSNNLKTSANTNQKVFADAEVTHAVANADEEGYYNDNVDNRLRYTIENGEASVYAMDNSITSTEQDPLIIPHKISNGGNEYDVTSVGDSAFDGCEYLVNVILPNSIRDIGENAFNCCLSLKDFELTNSIINIGASAFSCCINLLSITISSNIENIGDWGFYGCSRLAEVYDLRAEPTSRDDFYTYLGVYTAKNGIKTSLDGIDHWTTINGILYYKNNADGTDLSAVDLIDHNATSFILDSHCTEICGAFAYCENLISATIPSTIEYIGFSSFYNCFNLETIYYNSTDCEMPWDLDEGNNWGACAFDCVGINVESGCTLIVGDNVESLPKGFLNGEECNATNIKTIIFGSSVETVGDYAFWHLEYLQSIVLNGALTSIGTGAFDGCINLKEIYTSATDANAYPKGLEGTWKEYSTDGEDMSSTTVAVSSILGNVNGYRHFIRPDYDYGWDDESDWDSYDVAEDLFILQLDSEVALNTTANSDLYTFANSNKTAYMVCLKGGLYGPLPQGANGENASYRYSGSKIKQFKAIASDIAPNAKSADNLAQNDIYLAVGYVPTFPNTGVGVDIILPSAIILTLSVAIMFVALGGKKRKIIVK